MLDFCIFLQLSIDAQLVYMHIWTPHQVKATVHPQCRKISHCRTLAQIHIDNPVVRSIFPRTAAGHAAPLTPSRVIPSPESISLNKQRNAVARSTGSKTLTGLRHVTIQSFIHVLFNCNSRTRLSPRYSFMIFIIFMLY